jgi:hypothetical protein
VSGGSAAARAAERFAVFRCFYKESASVVLLPQNDSAFSFDAIHMAGDDIMTAETLSI